ncbi:hypothetical protein Gogos_004924, partial [Gossypium gossypioides]|nr:hypothetical protein [Gossypium gossypioides]
DKIKQLFCCEYGDLPYLLDVKVDKYIFQALTQYWNLAYSCFTFGKVDLAPTVEEYTTLLRCPKIQIDKAYSKAANVLTFLKRLMNITGMNEQWDLILVHPDIRKKVNIFALSIYGVRVEELEKSLHQHHSRNSVTELKASLTKIEELKRNIEELELEVALQNYELRVELLETNNEHWKEQLQCTQGQIRDRDHIMSETLTQVPEVADHLQTLAVQADILSLRYESELDRGRELAWVLKKIKALNQLQGQLHDQLANVQQDMIDQIEESHRSIINQLTQLLAGGIEKRKSVVINSKDDNEDLTYPPGFTPVHIQTQPDTYSRKLEDRCKWLEEKFKAMESTNYLCRINSKELSLVLDLVLSPKFKTPEFDKYNGTSCAKAHITMFDQRMTGCAKINSWKDLAQAFMKQYNHVTDMTPNRITLQNMEKKKNESFRQYAQRWRDVATQVQPPLLEKETTILFVNTLKSPLINHMLGSATRSFLDIVMFREMIENAIRSGKINAGESAKRSAPRKKENKVNIASVYNKGYSKPIIMAQPRTMTTNHQCPSRQELHSRPNIEKFKFLPIQMIYGELY